MLQCILIRSLAHSGFAVYHLKGSLHTSRTTVWYPSGRLPLPQPHRYYCQISKNCYAYLTSTDYSTKQKRLYTLTLPSFHVARISKIIHVHVSLTRALMILNPQNPSPPPTTHQTQLRHSSATIQQVSHQPLRLSSQTGSAAFSSHCGIPT